MIFHHETMGFSIGFVDANGHVKNDRKTSWDEWDEWDECDGIKNGEWFLW